VLSSKIVFVKVAGSDCRSRWEVTEDKRVTGARRATGTAEHSPAMAAEPHGEHREFVDAVAAVAQVVALGGASDAGTENASWRPRTDPITPVLVGSHLALADSV